MYGQIVLNSIYRTRKDDVVRILGINKRTEFWSNSSGWLIINVRSEENYFLYSLIFADKILAKAKTPLSFSGIEVSPEIIAVLRGRRRT